MGKKPGPKKGQAVGPTGRTIGREGGKVGGPARSKALTPAERSKIAREGGLAKNRQSGKAKKKRDSGD